MSEVKTIKNLREDNQYQDITADGLEGVAVERLPRVPSRRFIKMQPQFEELPAEDRAVYWHSLASALNDALDTMQQERNQLIETCQHQEGQVTALHKRISDLNELIMRNTLESNARQNRRAEELHEVKQQHSRAIRQIKREKNEMISKYMSLVGSHEGTYFIDVDQPEEFTSKEWNVLHRIAKGSVEE